LIPSASVAVIAGMPASVAGILIIRFGRSTVFHRSAASAQVSFVWWASRGSTSSETRPSTAAVRSHASRNRSHPSRTSVVVSSRTMSSTEASRAASSRSWSS
jgi:hypothetical protein